MATSHRIPIVPLGLSLAIFFVITYILCLLFGLFASEQGLHQYFPNLIPGYTGINLTSSVIGGLWSIAYAWYIALIFAPIYNQFAAREG